MHSGAKCTREQQVQEPVVKPKFVSKYVPNVKDMNQDKGKTTDMKVQSSKSMVGLEAVETLAI